MKFITEMKVKWEGFYRSVCRTGGRVFDVMIQIELSVCLSSISSSSLLSFSSSTVFSLLTLFRWVVSVLLWWPFECPFSWPLMVASSIDSTVFPNLVDCVSFDVIFVLLMRLAFVGFVRHSEFRLRPNRGKKLFSTCSCALISLVFAHVKAFINDFLKLSLRKAYRIGFIAEFE